MIGTLLLIDTTAEASGDTEIDIPVCRQAGRNYGFCSTRCFAQAAESWIEKIIAEMWRDAG